MLSNNTGSLCGAGNEGQLISLPQGDAVAAADPQSAITILGKGQDTRDRPKQIPLVPATPQALLVAGPKRILPIE
jgi:hypothetical protein